MLLLLSACFVPPSASGPDALIGTLVDAAGKPVPGVMIETLEGRSETAADGKFDVQYKEPDQLAHFARGALYFERRYQPADDGQLVTLQLPEVADGQFRCAVPVPCDLEARWDLPDGLVARLKTRCDPAAPAPLAGVPVVAATDARCTAASGEVFPLDLQHEADGSTTAMMHAQALRVEIRGEEGAQPQSCEVLVGGEVATPAGSGFWEAPARGTVVVRATCDGRPAFPKIAQTGEPAVQLEWSNTGPRLDLATVVPGGGELVIVVEGAGVEMRIQPDAAGVYALPPLPIGLYRMAVGDPALLLASPPDWAKVEPGALAIVAVSPGNGGAGAALGLLRLETDLNDGEIPIVAR